MDEFLINLRYNVGVQEKATRSSDHQLLLLGAAIYTALGLIWGVVAVLTIEQALRSLAILGVIVVLVLLLGGFIRQIRDAALIPVDVIEPRRVQNRSRLRPLTALAAVILVLLLVSVLILQSANRHDWLLPAAASIFCLHFFILPSSTGLRTDALWASAALVVVLGTPLWLPDRPMLWSLAAVSACALACWLAADARLQRARVILNRAQERTLDASSEKY